MRRDDSDTLNGNRDIVLERCNLQVDFALFVTGMMFAEFCIRQSLDPVVLVNLWRDRILRHRQLQKRQCDDIEFPETIESARPAHEVPRLALAESEFMELLDSTTDELNRYVAGAADLISKF